MINSFKSIIILYILFSSSESLSLFIRVILPSSTFVEENFMGVKLVPIFTLFLYFMVLSSKSRSI